MKRTSWSAALAAALFLMPSVWAQNEVVVTTYYPAPWGEYTELRAKKAVMGTVAGPDVDSNDTLTVYGDVQVNSRVNVGSPGPAANAPEGYYLQGQPFSGGGGGIRQVLTTVGTSDIPPGASFSTWRLVPQMRRVITTQSNAYLMIFADISMHVGTGACAFEIRVDSVRVGGTFTTQDLFNGWIQGITGSASRIALVGPGQHVVDVRFIANDNYGALTASNPDWFGRTLTVADVVR